MISLLISIVFCRSSSHPIVHREGHGIDRKCSYDGGSKTIEKGFGAMSLVNETCLVGHAAFLDGGIMGQDLNR